jgi:Sulfotransferase domain
VRHLAELVPTIPTPVRRVLREAVWTYGRLTSPLRSLPDFLIVGAQRSGTTALFSYLQRHPAVSGPPWKEVNFFDVHHHRGEGWYRGHFVSSIGRARARRRGVELVAGEASPSYLFHPLAAERAAALLPGARVIALLRDPVDRALSHYNHEVALGREPLSFEQALDAEESRLAGELERMAADPRYFSFAWWNHTYLARGRYAEQLERWLGAFPPEQVLVLTTEELDADTQGAYDRVLAHAGLPPHRLPSFPHVFSREYAPMAEETRGRLKEYFAGPNARLAKLLGRDPGWA